MLASLKARDYGVRLALFTLFVVIAAVFSPLAAVMAFLITYEEYSHHHLGRRELLGRSLGAAAVTLVFFLLLVSLVGGLLAGLENR